MFRVQGLGVQGLGFGVWGLGFRVWGLGFRVQGSLTGPCTQYLGNYFGLWVMDLQCRFWVSV